MVGEKLWLLVLRDMAQETMAQLFWQKQAIIYKLVLDLLQVWLATKHINFADYFDQVARLETYPSLYCPENSICKCTSFVYEQTSIAYIKK